MLASGEGLHIYCVQKTSTGFELRLSQTFFFRMGNHQMTSAALGGAGGSVIPLLTKIHPCSFLCPLRSGSAVSLSNNPQPRQASALTGPSSCWHHWHLFEARLEHERAVDTASRYRTYGRWATHCSPSTNPRLRVAGSRLAAPDARSVSSGGWEVRLSSGVPPSSSPTWLLRRRRWLLPIPTRSRSWPSTCWLVQIKMIKCIFCFVCTLYYYYYYSIIIWFLKYIGDKFVWITLKSA